MSAVRMENNAELSGSAVVKFNFLGISSAESAAISLGSKAVHPINFSAYMKFNKAACTELTAEIEDQGDDLCLEIVIISDSKENRKVIGIAVVNLWVMVVDSCNILRQVLHPSFSA